MARGWESKSVEAQQAEAADGSSGSRTKMTPEQAARFRQIQTLRLARERIVQQRAVSTSERHRELLDLSLAELDERLRKLE